MVHICIYIHLSIYLSIYILYMYNESSASCRKRQRGFTLEMWSVRVEVEGVYSSNLYIYLSIYPSIYLYYKYV